MIQKHNNRIRSIIHCKIILSIQSTLNFEFELKKFLFLIIIYSQYIDLHTDKVNLIEISMNR